MTTYVRVPATAEERAEYRESHGYAPAVYRVRCATCGKRMWGSGLGLGSHNNFHKKERAQAAWKGTER